MNASDFKKSILAEGRRVQEAELQARRDYAETIFTKIVIRTPVKTGLARSNWRIGLERNNRSVLSVADPTGAVAFAQAIATLKRMTSLQTRIFITNPLPYINRLENGWSDQAPAGMVQITLAEADEIVGRALYARIGGKGGELVKV